jgi:hypothetical protein
MRKLILSVAAATIVLSAASVAANAQEISTKTFFENEHISGVNVGSAFEVVLIKSLESRAVVEINTELENGMQVSRNADGVVAVNLNDISRNVWREFNRRPENERTMRLTLYLPSLSKIELSGVAHLSSIDSFSGNDVEIELSGASTILNHLEIATPHIKIDGSGTSRASLLLAATQNLEVETSGASLVEIDARGLEHSRLMLSGSSQVTLRGDGVQGEWSASGAAKITTEEFEMNELTLETSGASSARVNVSGTLTTHTSGNSSIRYRGEPATLLNMSRSVEQIQ